MSFKQLFQFLNDLQENNDKSWMDANRKYYEETRDWYIAWLDKMNKKLATLDEDYTDTPGKKGINRINNNLLFHPNKPVYKDHFGAGLDQEKKQGDYYLQIGNQHSFIAGGYYKPEKKLLQSIREAIDFNGDELIEIINKPSFKALFGELYDKENRLVNAPKGYPKDHKHIELLRYKTFAVECSISKKDILSTNFNDCVIEIYFEMLPFRRYLNKATSV